MISWFDSTICQNGHKCERCRKRHGGKSFRKRVASQYTVPSESFDCPHGKPWIEDKPREVINMSDSPRARYNRAVDALMEMDPLEPKVSRMLERLQYAARDIGDNSHCYPCVEKVYLRFIKAFEVVFGPVPGANSELP